MESSKENQRHKVFNQRNRSDSDIQSKRFSVIPDGEDLHIVGFRVKVGDDQACSIALQTLRSKSANVLKILTHPKNLKLSPENNKIEVHVKSKANTKDDASDDKRLVSNSDYCGAEDKFVELPNSHISLLKPSYKSSVVPGKHVTEISVSETETDQDIESSGMPTEHVKVRQPACTQGTTNLTNRTREISTVTDKREIKSVGSQTDVIPKKPISIQTDKEAATGSSQCERAALHSMDRVYNVSTQTKQVEDAGTSTDFNNCMHLENVSEKSVGTEDVSCAPLIVENADVDVGKVFGEQECRCFCGHRNHTRCIFKCCLHKDIKDIRLERFRMCPFIRFATSSSTSSQCNHCHCRSTRNCNVISQCDENFRIDAHQLHCCKCDVKTQCEAEQFQEAKEKLKAFKCIQIDKVNSLATRKKVSSQSQVEIAKNLKKELKNLKIVVAERVVQPSKLERASVLQIPVVHYLTNYVLSSCRSFQRVVVVNPIDIILSGNQTTVFGQSTDAQQKATIDCCAAADEYLEDAIKKNLLMIFDGKKTKSVRFAPTPPQPIAATDDKHTQINLCKKCYSNVHDVIKKEKFSHSSRLQHSIERKSMSEEGQRISTSPKIRHRDFNYTSKDTWKPFDRTNDNILDKKVQETDINSVGKSFSKEFFESAKSIGLSEACEMVNNHLLSLCPVDQNTVRNSAKFLHKRWFETAGSKYADIKEVRNYIQYLEEFSNNLLQALLYSVDNNSNNVLHFAFANNRFDLADEILNNEFGVDLLKKTNKTGNSPLMLCSISHPKSNSEWATVRRTFEIGDVDAMSVKSGQTALMNASSCGFHAMVNLLLDVGANPNLQDKDGSTALMYAAEHGQHICAKSLLNHKSCDPTIRDKDGQTACSIALSNGHKILAELIHKQTLEKKKQSKNSYCSKRYIGTNNENNASGKRALSTMPSDVPLYKTLVPQ